MPSPLPKAFGRYEIDSELGRGMMGVVYRAKDPTLGRVVALKTLNVTFAISEDEREIFEQRFLNEARLAAGLSHPNIVVVHDVGRDEASGTPYIALEFLHGETLLDRVPPPLGWREALRIGARLADALHHAHSHGIVHRDIKPANVMLLAKGEPKIMDFGIARAPTSNLTAAGEFFGTPSYMSPEQAAGDPVDGRSDLFSLGAVLYFLLTGRRAFEGKSVPAILAKVERESPPRPSSVVEDIPEAVDAVVLRLLEKKPDARYQDGTQLAEDIEDVLSERTPRHVSLQRTLVGEPTLPGRAAQQSATTGPGVETRALRALEGPRGVLALAGLVGLVLLLTLFLGRGPAAIPPVPETETTAPGPSATASGATSIPSPLPSAAGVGSALPGSAPAPAETSAAAGAAPSRASARLTIALEHNVKDGKLRVSIDQKPVLERALSSQETKKALFFKGRKGQLFETIDLPPGDHNIRVEVQDGEETKAGVMVGAFRRGETRLLEVRVGGQIELEWR